MAITKRLTASKTATASKIEHDKQIAHESLLFENQLRVDFSSRFIQAVIVGLCLATPQLIVNQYSVFVLFLIITGATLYYSLSLYQKCVGDHKKLILDTPIKNKNS